MEIEAKDLIVGGFLTLVASISASWATMKSKLSSNKEIIDKELSTLKESIDKMESTLKKEITETNRLLHLFIDDGGSCDARQRSCKNYIYNRVLDDHGMPLFADKAQCKKEHDEVKLEFTNLRKKDEKLFELLNQILIAVNKRND